MHARARNALRLGLILISGVLVAGCESLQVIQTPEIRGTGGTGKVRVSALTIQKQGLNIPGVSNPLGPTRDRNKEPKAIQNACFPLQEVKRVPGQPLGVGLTTIPLIMAGVEVIYSYLSNTLKDSATEKIKRFQAPYDGQVNVASFAVGDDDGRVRCLELTRTIGEESPTPASRIVLGLTPVGKTAIEINPVYVRLNQLAASTTPKDGGGHVSLAITVGIETLASDGGDLGVRHYQRNIKLQNIRAGQDYENPNANPSAILPLPTGQPATIAVAVTETGDGFQSVEDFEKAFDNNSKIIGNAIGKAIETRLMAISKKD